MAGVIRVERLSRRYGKPVAVDAVSSSVRSGLVTREHF
jgi:ABC-type Na+ transport system ATPase subunit NatA